MKRHILSGSACCFLVPSDWTPSSQCHWVMTLRWCQAWGNKSTQPRPTRKADHPWGPTVTTDHPWGPTVYYRSSVRAHCNCRSSMRATVYYRSSVRTHCILQIIGEGPLYTTDHPWGPTVYCRSSVRAHYILQIIHEGPLYTTDHSWGPTVTTGNTAQHSEITYRGKASERD